MQLRAKNEDMLELFYQNKKKMLMQRTGGITTVAKGGPVGLPPEGITGSKPNSLKVTSNNIMTSDYVTNIDSASDSDSN